MQCAELLNSEATQNLAVCVASSFHWSALATPAVVSVSALVALWGVSAAKATARKRATLDMIEKVESAPHYRALHEAFANRRKKKSFTELNDPIEKQEKADRQSVIDYLNHYELVAIGIRTKILDPTIYQKWMKGPFLRDWNAAAAFIQRERWKWDDGLGAWAYHRQQFENYQHVARQWDPEFCVDLDEKYSSPPQRPSGPGDESLPDGSPD